ncbi:MAG: hypothetical protein KGJ13_01235 [Patescibacteria group bacterium]|nr:hypothetical protein [Patescibacteria group bacterium]
MHSPKIQQHLKGEEIMTTTSLITGTVAGFALVIDPANEKGKRERIECPDFASIKARVLQLHRENVAAYNADPRNYDPIETHYFTLYRRDDNGATEEDQAFDLSGNTNVGDAAHKKFCKCGKSSWWKNREGWSQSPSYTCEDCNKPEDDGYGGDFSDYDGGQEREY